MFPLFFDITNKPCLIVGGGNVAFRKAKTLLQFNVDLAIVSPQICPEIKADLALASLVRKGDYQLADLTNQFLVIAATADPDLNQAIVLACNQRHILVNSATPCQEGEVVAFPSIIKQGLVTIGINSSGNPALSKELRKRIEACLPEYLAAKAQQTKVFRDNQKQNKTGKALQDIMTQQMKNL